MQNNVIMQLRMEKSKHEKKFKELEIKIIRLLGELSTVTIPYFEDVEDIKTEEIKQIADELLVVQQKAVETKKKIKQIQLTLGE